MKSILDQPFDLSCPNPKCKRNFGLKYSDIVNRGKAHCNSCGSEMNFNSSTIRNLRYAASDFEKAQEKLNSAISHITSDAEVNIKPRI